MSSKLKLTFKLASLVTPLFAFLLVFVFDQLLKYHAFRSGIALLNPGFTFGWAGDSGLLFPLSALLVSLILSLYCIRSKCSLNFGIFLVIAGFLSNLIDRLNYHGVVDYLKIPYLNIYNNLGDWGIFLGSILIILEWLIFQNHKSFSKMTPS